MQVAIPMALGVFLMWYVYAQYTPEQRDEVFSQFKNANYGVVIIAVLMSALSHLLRAYRWNFMLAPLGYRPQLANNFMAVCVAYLMNLFIPKSGEISRAAVLDKYEKVPFEKGFGTIVSERIVDLIFLLIFTLVALFLQFDLLYEYLTNIVPVKKIGISIGILALLFGLFLLFLKYSKGAISNKIKALFTGLKAGIFSILKMEKKGLFILYSLLIWLLYISSFYVSTYALAETTGIDFGIIIITFVVGSFTFAFTNSGFGYYQVAIAGILMVFGVPETVGTALGWIVWGSNIVYILIAGGISFILLPIYNRKRL